MNRYARRRGSRRRRATVAGAAGGGLVAVATVLSGGVAQAAPVKQIVVGSDSGAAAGANAGTTLYGQTASGKGKGESLADAITYLDDRAISGATITFSSKVTGIDLTAALPEIDKPMTIDGGGRVTIDGGDNNTTPLNAKTFNLESGLAATTVIEGLALQHAGDGAILAYSPLDVSRCLFTDDTGRSGPGVDSYANTVISDSTFADDTYRNGSAIRFEGSSSASLKVVGSTFDDNKAPEGYGALDLVDEGSVTIEDSTITGNSGGGSGAGVYSDSPTLTIIGSTITGNTLTYTTVRGAGAGIWIESGVKATLDDTVVAGNTAPEGDPDMDTTDSSDVVKASFSFMGDDAGSGITPNSTDIFGTTGKVLGPLLAPLAVNGGPTETMLPLPDSPLVDAGKPFGLGHDQRGYKRTFDFLGEHYKHGSDGTDIGAVELQATDWGKTISRKVGDQKLKLTVPSGSFCRAPGSTAWVVFETNRAHGSPKLTFDSVSIWIGAGIKHHGVYAPNAEITKHSATVGVSLKGLHAGTHRLKAVVSYTKVGGGSLTRTFREPVKLC